MTLNEAIIDYTVLSLAKGWLAGTYSWIVRWVSSEADLISTFEFSSVSPAQIRHYMKQLVEDRVV